MFALGAALLIWYATGIKPGVTFVDRSAFDKVAEHIGLFLIIYGPLIFYRKWRFESNRESVAAEKEQTQKLSPDMHL